MDLDCTLFRLDDALQPCPSCGAEVAHRQYDNGRQHLFVCTACAMVWTVPHSDRPDGEDR